MHGVNSSRILSEYLSYSRRHGKPAVAVYVDFADDRIAVFPRHPASGCVVIRNLGHVVDQVPTRLGRAGGQYIPWSYVFKLGKIFVKETCQFFCLNIVFMRISPGIAGS